MNYLHVIELLNQMERKVVEIKLVTYTKRVSRKCDIMF